MIGRVAYCISARRCAPASATVSMVTDDARRDNSRETVWFKLLAFSVPGADGHFPVGALPFCVAGIFSDS